MGKPFDMKTRNMKMKTRKAFSLIELLIVVLIMGILGGGAVMALWSFMGYYLQTDDYTKMDMEIEGVIQQLTREFALAGLGMPNNRQGYGSFALSFMDENGDESKWPVMAYFGDPFSTTPEERAWGGPVTVSGESDANIKTNGETAPVLPEIDGDMYVGPELYYAWGIPVRNASDGARAGAKVRVWTDENKNQEAGNASNRTKLFLDFVDDSLLSHLLSQMWDRRQISLGVGSPHVVLSVDPKSPRGWLVMPTLRLPMRVDPPLYSSGSGGYALNVTVAPVNQNVLTPLNITLEHDVSPLDDVHFVQAARLSLRDNAVVRSYFGPGVKGGSGTSTAEVSEDTLTWNVHVAQMYFAYDSKKRILSMFIAVRGVTKPPNGPINIQYPDWLPESAYLTDEDLQFRVAAKTLSWRIRN